MFHEMARASIRDLRTRFPYVRRLLERDGEVIVTDRGRPVVILRLYEQRAEQPAPPVDYFARLRKRMPRPLSRTARRALDEASRAER